MAAAPLRLTIVTPTGRTDGKVGPVLDTWVDEVTAPGVSGEFQVLPVSILAEGAAESGEIDMAKTIAQKEKYEKLLMEIGPMDPRYDETRKAIKELVALMTVAQRKK